MYPVPTNRAAAEPKINPTESAVPSSINWYPTAPFIMRIHVVATTEATWTATKALRTAPSRGKPPMVKISQIDIMM